MVLEMTLDAAEELVLGLNTFQDTVQRIRERHAVNPYLGEQP